MKDTITHQEQLLIQKYLNKQLTDSERAAFYRQIAGNKTLAKHFLLQKKLSHANETIVLDTENDSIVDNNTVDTTRQIQSNSFEKRAEMYRNLRKSLDNSETSENNETKNTKIFAIRYRKEMFAAAAMLIVLFASTFYLVYMNNNMQNTTPVAIVDEQNEPEKHINENKQHETEKKQAEEKESSHNAVSENNTEIVVSEKIDLETLLKKYASEAEKNDALTLMAYANKNNVELPERFEENSFLTSIATSTMRSENFKFETENFVILQNPVVLKFDADNLPNEISIKNNKKEVRWMKSKNISETNKCNVELKAGTFYLFVTYQKNGEEKQIVRQFFVTD